MEPDERHIPPEILEALAAFAVDSEDADDTALTHDPVLDNARDTGWLFGAQAMAEFTGASIWAIYKRLQRSELNFRRVGPFLVSHKDWLSAHVVRRRGRKSGWTRRQVGA